LDNQLMLGKKGASEFRTKFLFQIEPKAKGNRPTREVKKSDHDIVTDNILIPGLKFTHAEDCFTPFRDQGIVKNNVERFWGKFDNLPQQPQATLPDQLMDRNLGVQKKVIDALTQQRRQVTFAQLGHTPVGLENDQSQNISTHLLKTVNPKEVSKHSKKRQKFLGYFDDFHIGDPFRSTLKFNKIKTLRIESARSPFSFSYILPKNVA